MKALSISLLALTFSSAYAVTPISDLQTTLTVQRSDVALARLQKKQTQEEVAFEFEKTHTLLEESRSRNTPTTLILPLGNNETVEVSVQGKTNHVGQFVWQNGRFGRKEHSYLGFEGSTKDGGRVRGFISEGAFSTIIHSAKSGRILVKSKSLQIGEEAEESSAIQNVSEYEESNIAPSTKTLFSPLQPTQFQSPVDGDGNVQLRHIGLAFTLSWNTFHALDPQVTRQQLVDDPNFYSAAATNWLIDQVQQMDETLMSQLGITIESIGDGLGEKRGFGYTIQVPDGYPDQPADSIFGGTFVPDSVEGWAYANDNFQNWVVQNSDPAEQIAAWWDVGMALGYGTSDPSTSDPLGGVVPILGNLCGSHKGASYVSSDYPNLFGSSQHRLHILHELGHAMGAQHTFSSSAGTCGVPGRLITESAVEPGSGSTIMSYAGFCAPNNVQELPSPYFHGKSIEQINTFFGNLEVTDTCISHASTENERPVLTMSAYPDRNIIPPGVRFKLSTLFTDPDLDARIAQNPASVSNDTKSEGVGQVNWEQIDSLADTVTLGPQYRSRIPVRANSPSDFVATTNGGYRKGYARSFPDESHSLGEQWDPLITSWDTVNYPIGVMHFRATGWDDNADAGAGFPGFVSADVPVLVSNSLKPVFVLPSANQVIKAGQSFTVTWAPNFAATQPTFASISLAYKKINPNKQVEWITLITHTNAPSNLSNFTIQIPKQTNNCSKGLGISYTSGLRLEYATLGDVTWYVESPDFQVQDEIISCSGFEGPATPSP